MTDATTSCTSCTSLSSTTTSPSKTPNTASTSMAVVRTPPSSTMNSQLPITDSQEATLQKVSSRSGSPATVETDDIHMDEPLLVVVDSSHSSSNHDDENNVDKATEKDENPSRGTATRSQDEIVTQETNSSVVSSSSEKRDAKPQIFGTNSPTAETVDEHNNNLDQALDKGMQDFQTNSSKDEDDATATTACSTNIPSSAVAEPFHGKSENNKQETQDSLQVATVPSSPSSSSSFSSSPLPPTAPTVPATATATAIESSTITTTTSTLSDTAVSVDENPDPQHPSSPSSWVLPSLEAVQAARQGSLVDGGDSDDEDDSGDEAIASDEKNNNLENGKNEEATDTPCVMLDVPVTPMGDVDPWAVYNETDDYAKMEFLQEEPVKLSELQIGDHVYQWRSWIGIPGVFQHHGIVIDIQQVPADDDVEEADNDAASTIEGGKRYFEGAESEIMTPPKKEEEKERRMVSQLVIADFSNIQRQKGRITSASNAGIGSNQVRSTSGLPTPIPTTKENQEDGDKNDDQEEEEKKEKEPQTSSVNPNITTTRITTELRGFEHDKKSLFGLHQQGTLRVYPTTDTQSWYKVQYEAPFWKRQVFSRAGTCTFSKSNPVGLVLARVHFILNHPHLLPSYHVLYANCECVAVWCKTGNWSTLQAASLLEYTAAGQVKSTGTLAAAAAHTQVSVPATGLWGWMGYTTKMSLLTAQPMLVPALAGYGIVSVGAPALLYHTAKKHWRTTTQELQTAFWEAAMESPNDFSENLMSDWSRYR